MRKNLIRAAAILGVATSAILVASVGSGCGGDDTVILAPPDGSVDATAETSVQDVGTQDVTNVDAGADSNPPPFDAGVPTLATFNFQEAQIVCNRLAVCCNGADTAKFDLVKCTNALRGNGFNIGWTNPVQPFIDAGNVGFDVASANKCFGEINAIGCGAVSSAVITQIHTDCLAAVPGKIPVGSTGCTGSPECVPPAHCEIDAGTGTCALPRAVGQACGGKTFAEDLATCGRLVSGVPGYCAGSSSFLRSNACESQQPLDAGCNGAQECQSQLCRPTADPRIIDAGGLGACSDQNVVATASLCNAFAVPDAGPADAASGG